MDCEDFLDLKRSEGEGNEGSNLVADLEVTILEIIADVSDLTDEHTAGAGNGVLLLAALGDDAHDHFADLLLITAADLRDLGEGCGVNVKGDDVADDLVGVTLGHIVVDLPCCLSEYALGLDDPVSTVFVSFKLFHKLNLLMI